MAYAAPANMILRYDTRRLCQLVTDDDSEEVEVGDLASNTILLAMLKDAQAHIDQAVTQGDRYDPDDLEALTDPLDAGLIRLTCDLAYGLLVARRGYPAAELAQLAPRYAEALQTLERLKLGEEVFPFQAHRNAGAAVDTYRPIDNLLRPPVSSEIRIFGVPRNEF